MDVLKGGNVIASTYTENSLHQNELVYYYDGFNVDGYAIRFAKANQP